MKDSVIAKLIPVACAIVGVVLLYIWLSADAAVELGHLFGAVEQ